MKPALMLSEKSWQQPRGLERTKMKDVIRSWNAVPPPPKPNAGSQDRQSPMDANWAHAQSEDSTRTSISSSESETSDWENDSAACLENKEEEEGFPMSVGQIQHVYRARARREDERVAAKFAEIARQSRIKEPIVRRRSQPKAAVVARSNATGSATREPCFPAAYDPFMNLSLQRMSSDPTYCEELLGLIRTELLAGRDVCLHSDCTSTCESLGDTRLMLQQLCTRSLLFCRRDQDVVPQLVPPHALQLLLLPRHPQ